MWTLKHDYAIPAVASHFVWGAPRCVEPLSSVGGMLCQDRSQCFTCDTLCTCLLGCRLVYRRSPS